MHQFFIKVHYNVSTSVHCLMVKQDLLNMVWGIRKSCWVIW